MPIEVVTFSLGPMDNNTYLLVDPLTKQCVVVDPSFQSEQVRREIDMHALSLTAVWLTHAHFDHIAGVEALTGASDIPLQMGLHPDDLPLLRQGGGARLFGVDMDPLPDPSLTFSHGQALQIGAETVEVRHAPGHTPGHVIFYLPTGSLALVGDVIFYHGIGRTDLPGGDSLALDRSIREQVLTLPPETRLLSGHGPETTVAEEQENNPFVY